MKGNKYTKTMTNLTHPVFAAFAFASLALLHAARGGSTPPEEENPGESTAEGLFTVHETVMNGQFVYAAHNDGTITVHDINNSHSLVKTINVFSVIGANLRGAAAAVPTARLYLFYNVNQEGHVACVDLTNDSVIWDEIAHTPGVDRGDVTPDGTKLYVPTWEDDPNSLYELVLDGGTGGLLSTIAMPPRTHDTFCSLDGTKVFMENKDDFDHAVRVASTANDQVVFATNQFSGKVQPFAVTADNKFLVANVVGTYGFQYADLTTGEVLGSAFFVGSTYHGSWPHGIGMTPDQREAWVCDRGTGNPFVHVFDITSLPPQQTHLVTLPYDNPSWLTFTIDGRYCYVKAPPGIDTAIVGTSTYQIVGALPSTQILLEIDFNNGNITAVGSQYGVGRDPTASPPPTATPTPTPTPTATIQVTVQTNPVGLSFSVDGTTYSSTQMFSWVPGSRHTVATTSPQNGSAGVRYTWTRWSDNGAISHTVTATTNKTYTANFSTQYFLAMSHGTGGTVMPSSGWRNAGATVSITATPTNNNQVSYSFTGWTGTGAGSYSGTNNPASITMNGPITENAAFTQNPVQVTVQTNPAGLSFSVDGTTYTATQTFAWVPGSSHTIATTTPQNGDPGVRYVWTSWSGGGAISHTVAPTTNKIYTTNFNTQYFLTMAHETGGSVSPATGWKTSGVAVSINAMPANGYSFTNWTGTGTGSFSGATNPASITMGGPITETATFTHN
jgi:hypothetical protein